MIRNLAMALMIALGLPTGSLLAAENYSAMSCPQLWYARNVIYKAHGYCFQSQEGIKTFGNEGCTAIDEKQLGLSPAEKTAIAQIILAERTKLCR